MHNKNLRHLRRLVVLAASFAPSVTPLSAWAQSPSISASDVQGFATSTFQSDAFKALQRSLSNQASAVIGGIDNDAIGQIKSQLPKLQAVGTRIKYGTHNVVTNEGESIVEMIILLPRDSQSERDVAIKKLVRLSDQGIPEAQNFIGFSTEYGLFGYQRNLQRALELYSAAAAQNYQPAIYNLGIAAAYGKGESQNLGSALMFAGRAAAIGPDSSFRVCGFGAFLSYRMRNQDLAERFSRACWSALADIPKALYGTNLKTSERVGLLRASIATGLDDGYPLLVKVTDEGKDPEARLLHCKYVLVEKYRSSSDVSHLPADAQDCYDRLGEHPGGPSIDAVRQDNTVEGIIGFTQNEIRALHASRVTNHFHYGWSVPYLPFAQQDVDLFEQFINSRTKNNP